MSRGRPRRSSAPDPNVFINCPFDEGFRPCFEALLFAVTAGGYKVRCALEDADGASIRFEKLRKLIRECPYTIHDLSRIELSKDALPRFNMPFELGLAMGAKYFGGPKQRGNSALIMVRKDYILSAYLSDLGGNDPVSHNGNPEEVIAVVTRYLHATPAGQVLPGPRSAITRFARFKEGLPAMAAALDRDQQEVHPYKDYRVYLALLNEFLRSEQEAGA
jgi:hypothetical protein